MEETIAAEAIASLTGANEDTSTEDREENNDDEGDGENSVSDTDAAAKPVESTEKPTSKDKKPRRKYKKRVKDPVHKFPVSPRIIQAIHKPKSYINHSYRDFSEVPPERGYSVPTKIEDMDFPQKIHHILSDPKNHNMICWMPHGRAFKVLRPSDFEKNLMQTYFGHTRYSWFLSMLRQHGFKHITVGIDRLCLYHEFFLRGLSHLLKYMPLKRSPRRLTEDPDNEPNFYAISNIYPVPPKGSAAEGLVPSAPPVIAPAASLPQAALLGALGRPVLNNAASHGVAQYPQVLASSHAPNLLNIPALAAAYPLLAASGAANQLASPLYGGFVAAAARPNPSAVSLVQSGNLGAANANPAAPGTVNMGDSEQQQGLLMRQLGGGDIV